MKYYKVNCGDWGYSINSNFTFLNGELLTPGEVKRYNIPEKVLQEVNIPSSRVYTTYGMRKEV